MLRPTLVVRPHERHAAMAAFLTLLVIMAGYALLETARDALFLARLEASRLPWAYLGIAAAALAVTTFQQRAGRAGGGRVALGFLLAASAAVTLVAWGVVGTGAVWGLYALYAWTGIFGTLVVVRFWGLIEDQFTITQAKRLFALIGAGGVLGAIAGSALATFLTGTLGTRSLLPAAAGLFLASSFGLLLDRKSEEEGGDARARSSPGAQIGEVLRQVQGHPYLRRVAVLLLLSTITLTMADYLFKSIVDQKIEPSGLGAFFAKFYLFLNILSLLVQVALAGWLLRRFGISRSLGVLPALLVLGGAGIALGGGLVAALLMKGADGSLRHSLHRTSMEVLYVPLSGKLRGRVKSFVDVLGQRGGQALASILILAAVAIEAPSGALGVAVALLAACWILLADSLQGHYLELFRASLRGGASRARGQEAALDVASLESLIAALSSSDDAEAVAALDLLAERRRLRLIPLLILYHPSARVLLRALEIFTEAGRQDLAPMAKRLLGHDDPEVRAAALRALSVVAPNSELLRDALSDPSPVVHATALVGLAASESAAWDQALSSVEAIASGGTLESKVALARAIQHAPSTEFNGALHALAREPSPAVRLEVIHAIEHRPDPSFLPDLLPMLERRELRPSARAALLAAGEEGLAFLESTLDDAATPARLRRHLPRTISRFEPRAAGRILVARLAVEHDGIARYKILRALNRIRAENPDLPLDGRVLAGAVRATLETVFRLINWRIDLERGAGQDSTRATSVQELLVTLLRHKEQHALERLFRLLGLQYPHEDLYRIYRSLRSASPKARASALELLQHLLASPVREAVLGLLDDVPDAQRLLVAGPFHAARSSSYTAVLNDILRNGGTTLPTLAAYHAGELGLEEMRPDLIAALEPGTPELRRAVLARALELMSLPSAERLAYGG